MSDPSASPFNERSAPGGVDATTQAATRIKTKRAFVYRVSHGDHPYVDGSPLYAVWRWAVMPLALRVCVDLRVTGAERIPPCGPLIIASNHVDNLDSYVIGSRLSRVVHFLARSNGMHSRWLGLYWRLMACLPADADGFKSAVTLLRGGHVIGVFPEGLISPAMVRAKPGVAVLALRSGAPVLPCAIWGTERVLRGSRMSVRRTIHVQFGEPRLLSRGSGRAQELTDALMCEIAGLLPESYRGCYA